MAVYDRTVWYLADGTKLNTCGFSTATYARMTRKVFANLRYAEYIVGFAVGRVWLEIAMPYHGDVVIGMNDEDVGTVEPDRTAKARMVLKTMPATHPLYAAVQYASGLKIAKRG